MSRSLAVLITYHDEGPLLRECLDSLAAQTGQKPDEILVYDDASVDPASGYVRPEDGARVIRGEKNIGPGAGRNLLMRASRCEYIHFHDTDDLFDAGWASRIREAMISGPDVILSNVRVLEATGHVRQSCLYNFDDIYTAESLGHYAISLRACLLPLAVVMRRELALRIEGYVTKHELLINEDYEFHARLACAARSFEVIHDAIVLQRQRTNSLCRIGGDIYRPQTYTSRVEALTLLSAKLPAEYRPELSEAAFQRALILKKRGLRAEAKRAFRLSDRLGGARYTNRNSLYRVAASRFGSELTEFFAVIYRWALPAFLRRFLQRVNARSSCRS